MSFSDLSNISALVFFGLLPFGKCWHKFRDCSSEFVNLVLTLPVKRGHLRIAWHKFVCPRHLFPMILSAKRYLDHLRITQKVRAIVNNAVAVLCYKEKFCQSFI